MALSVCVRTCTKCRLSKSEDQFVWRKKGHQRRNICRLCEADRNKARYARPETRQYHRNRAANPTVRARRRRQHKQRMLDPIAQERRRQKERSKYADPRVRDQVLAHRLRHQYGIDLVDYRRLLALQNGRCAVCRRLPTERNRICVDHDHATDEVRGLLCARCNRALGLLRDDPAVLASAIEYLRRRR